MMKRETMRAGGRMARARGQMPLAAFLIQPYPNNMPPSRAVVGGGRDRSAWPAPDRLRSLSMSKP